MGDLLPATELLDSIMYQHPFLQQGFELLKEVLCARSTITLLLGTLVTILLRKSLLGRQGSEKEQARSRYCSDACMRNHLPQHTAVCKKRAAELLREEILFRQPEGTHLGDCPICFLPLPLDYKKRFFHECCGKIACAGCAVANQMRERDNKLERTCPFCRHPIPRTPEEGKKNLMKRFGANDPIALWQMGEKHLNEGDYEGALKYGKMAAELGNADAHLMLAYLYRTGEDVEKDEKKELYHLEEAAMSGHPEARAKIGCVEMLKGNVERAVKHWILAARHGDDQSIILLKDYYKYGLVSKDDFAAALRAHQTALDATKSPQREAAERAMAGEPQGSTKWTLTSHFKSSRAS